jgi:hypothetical protein
MKKPRNDLFCFVGRKEKVMIRHFIKKKNENLSFENFVKETNITLPAF